MSIAKIELDVTKGSTLEANKKLAIKCALENDCRVYFIFNGVQYVVDVDKLLECVKSFS